MPGLLNPPHVASAGRSPRTVRTALLAATAVAAVFCAVAAFEAPVLFFAAGEDGGEGTPRRLGALCVVGGVSLLLVAFLAARRLLRRA